MPPRDRLVDLSATLVRVLLVLNLLGLALFALFLFGTWLFEQEFLARLAARQNVGEPRGSLTFLRWIVLIAIGAVAAAHLIFRALLRLIRLVSLGDPFVPEAATEVARIGWALLYLQLLDLCFGAVVWRLAANLEFRADWQPSLTGWIAVLVAFVLARVFRLGTAMRDELAGTI